MGQELGMFFAARWSDLVILAVSMFGTYWLGTKLLDKVHNPESPQVTEEAMNYVTRILRERKLQRSLTNAELYQIGAVVLPSMIDVSFEDIGGLDNIKEEIDQMIILPFLRPELFTNPLLSVPKGILLYGPPGTGKTTLAKAIAKQSKAVFIHFKSDQMFHKYVGESEKSVNALFSLALKLQPAVIFIDEADSVFGSRSSYQQEHMINMQSSLLALIDGLTTSKQDQVMVLACTNRPEALDPAFLRRMQRKFNVGLPNEMERARILRLKLSEEYIEPNFNYQELARRTEYFSGSDLELLCRTAAQYALREAARAGIRTHHDLRKITLQDCILALGVTTPTTRPVAYKPQVDQKADYRAFMEMMKELLNASNNNGVHTEPAD